MAKKLNRSEGFEVTTMGEVASFMKVSMPTVRDWRKEGMPGEKGKWDLQAIQEWHRQNKQGAYRNNQKMDLPDMDLEEGDSEQLERNRFYQAELKKLTLEERSAELWELDDIRDLFIRAMLSAKSALLAFSGKLPLLVEEKAIEESAKIIRAEVVDVLKDLADGLADGKAIKEEEVEKFIGLMGWND